MLTKEDIREKVMNIKRKILGLLTVFSISSTALAVNVDGAMSRVSRESKRDCAANMTHSHNADGSRRSRAEGQAIDSRNRAELSRRTKASAKSSEDKKKDSLHVLHEEHVFHETFEFHKTRRDENCFTGETLVTTRKNNKNMLKPIKDVAIGDIVVSCNLDDPEDPCLYQAVIATKQTTSDELVKIRLNQGELEATVGHRFYVYDEGWINAEDLQSGDRLISESGDLVFVEFVDVLDQLEEPIPVYDLRVDGPNDQTHNYYVGANRVLVHNCDIAIAGMPGAAAMEGGAVAAGTMVRGWMQAAAGAGLGLGLINKKEDSNSDIKTQTPETNSDNFENVRGSKAKIDKKNGEVWQKDLLHKDHWEVYKNKRNWEKGKRDRAVWQDGRLKQKF